MTSSRADHDTSLQSAYSSGHSPAVNPGCSARDALVAMMSVCAPELYAHARRVSHVATATARMMDLPAPLMEQIEQAALLHDIGKLAIAHQEPLPQGPDGELQACCSGSTYASGSTC